MVTTRSEDSDVLRCQPVGRVRQRGTVGLIHAGICRQGQPACSRFAPAPSASVAGAGAAWRGRISSKRTPAGRRRSSPTGVVSVGSWYCGMPARVAFPKSRRVKRRNVTRVWMMDLGMSLYVRIVRETLLQLFNNFQCHTQIDLRYR